MAGSVTVLKWYLRPGKGILTASGYRCRMSDEHHPHRLQAEKWRHSKWLLCLEHACPPVHHAGKLALSLPSCVVTGAAAPPDQQQILAKITPMWLYARLHACTDCHFEYSPAIEVLHADCCIHFQHGTSIPARTAWQVSCTSLPTFRLVWTHTVALKIMYPLLSLLCTKISSCGCAER